MKWLLFIALVIAGCAEAPRTAPQGTRIVGHGGMGPDHEFPMNTLEAAEACMASGADGVELDVQLSADGVLVCYHAQDLSELTNCSGLVHTHYWHPALFECSYGDASGNFRLTALESISNILDGTATLVLDCKLFTAGKDWTGYLQDFSQSLHDHVAKLDVPTTVHVECQVTEFLDLFKAGDSPFLTFYYATAFEDGLRTAVAHGYDGITIHSDLISSAQVKQAQDSGLQVALFGIDGNEEADAMAKGADLLQLDDP